MSQFKLDTRANKAAVQLEQQRLIAGHQKETAEQNIARLEKELTALTGHLQRDQQALITALSIYGITTLAEDNFLAVEKSLITRREQWMTKQLQKSSLDQNISSINLQIDHQSEQIGERTIELEKQRVDYENLLSAQKQLEQQRHALFDNKDPAFEEACLGNAVTTAQQQHDEANQNLQVASQDVTQLNSQIKAVVDSLHNRSSQLHTTETRFQKRLAEHSFVSEKDFITACISDEKRHKLSRKLEQLNSEQSGLNARQKDRNDRLNRERNKHITERSIEPLTQDLDATNNQLKTAQQELGACQQKLDDNKKLRASQQDRATAIDAQKIECERWDKLHLLIGSADGKKYRNFAQGLTFELLVGHANRQLQKMSDRYLLIRDKGEPLELNVIDNYQAGEIRSTKNLSGGESFIVSLALALGLSQMASNNVRVDSLFLDEGFGTLNEDALDTALEALSSLQQSGKLIGVISHVSSLKERIGTQILVSPKTGGRSLISGPGCQRLN